MGGKLEEKLNELGKEEYDVRFYLSKNSAIRLKRSEEEYFPTAELEAGRRIRNSDGGLVLIEHYSLKKLQEILDNIDEQPISIMVRDKEVAFTVEYKDTRWGACSGSTYEEIQKRGKSRLAHEGRELLQEALNETISVTSELIDKNSKYYTKELLDKYIQLYQKIAEVDLMEIRDSSEKSWEFNKTASFVDVSGNARTVYKIMNFLSLGYVKYAFKSRMEEIAERRVAWKILNNVSERFAEDLLEDSAYFRECDNRELAEKLELMQKFQYELSLIASRAEKRMQRFFEDQRNMCNLFGFSTPLPDLTFIDSCLERKGIF